MSQETLNITKERALSAYLIANGDTQKVLEELFGKHVLCPDPMTWVKTFDDVCKAAGVDIEQYKVHCTITEDSSAEEINAAMFTAIKRLKLIQQVFNGEWKPNFADTNQRKYYPWFNFIPDKEKPSGFGLSYFGCDCDRADSGLGVRPYFKDSNTAVYVGKQFLDEYEAYAQYENLSNQ